MNETLTTKKIFFFIVNPTSGNGKSKNIFPEIEEYLRKNNISFQSVYTEYKGHAVKLAEEISRNEQVKAIVAVGGDGTLSEVINGAFPTDIPIGYIPTGTGNDFARSMGIPREPIEAMKYILKMGIKNIDIGKINGHFFANVASMGFDAEVANYVNHTKLKNYLGKVVYVLGVIKALWTFKPKKLHLTIDGKDYFFDKVWLVAFANNKYYGGGMMISPNSVNDDGMLDIVLVNNLTRIKLLKLFPTIFKGKHINYSQVTVLKGKNIKVIADEKYIVQTDGEILTDVELTFSVIKKGLKIS